MKRQLVLLGSIVVMAGWLAGAQQFEVASVRQNLSDDRRSFGAQPGGRLVVRNFAVRDLIAAAYDMADIQPLIPDRILGGPEWIEAERYDIEAKASTEFQFTPGAPPRDAILMLRSLLEDRFKLAAHRETRAMPIFELVVAKPGQLGPGLRKTDLDCDALFASGRPPVPAAPRQPGEPPPCRLIGGPARTIAAGVTMQQLAANLSNHLGRFVVDRTGLTDRYDFNLAWTPDRLPPGPPPPGIPPIDPNGPPLVTALQEQLGLRVEPARGPVEVLVIDSVERPTPN
jgi:uncharacterized protein (TIGR03435 family)